MLVSEQPIYGRTSHGLLMTLMGSIICVGASKGSKVTEARPILYAVLKARDNGLTRVCILSDFKEVVDALKGSVDCGMNPIVFGY